MKKNKKNQPVKTKRFVKKKKVDPIIPPITPVKVISPAEAIEVMRRKLQETVQKAIIQFEKDAGVEVVKLQTNLVKWPLIEIKMPCITESKDLASC